MSRHHCFGCITDDLPIGVSWCPSFSDYPSKQASKTQGRKVITWLLLLPWQRAEVLVISDLYHHLYRSRQAKQQTLNFTIQGECAGLGMWKILIQNMQRESEKGAPSSLPTCWLLSWALALALSIYSDDQIHISKTVSHETKTKNPIPKKQPPKNQNIFPNKNILRTAIKCRISYL